MGSRSDVRRDMPARTRIKSPCCSRSVMVTLKVFRGVPCSAAETETADGGKAAAPGVPGRAASSRSPVTVKPSCVCKADIRDVAGEEV